ncbi:MAG TPA: glycosyltransferase, partial [Acidovorax sp.]
NKILEAMAMQRPVVTVSSCADAIGATAGQGLLRADTPEEFVQALQPLLESPYNAAALGQQARRYVEQECSWQAHLSGIDSCLSKARVSNPHDAGA